MTDYNLRGIREEAKTLYEEGFRELREIQRTLDAATGDPALAARRSAIAAEVTKLEAKLQRARALYEKLDGIRLNDPWSDGQALRVVWRNYTYLLLREGGLWYSTGKTAGAPYRFTWAQLVDWLVKADVAYVTELGGVSRVGLYETRSAMFCARRVIHGAHDFGEKFRCPGRSEASPDWAPVEWCGDQPSHKPHVWFQGEAREERMCHGDPEDVLGVGGGDDDPV